MGHYIESASEYVKQNGLASVQEACDITGVKHSTLYRWFRSKRKLFEAVVLGAVVMRDKK